MSHNPPNGGMAGGSAVAPARPIGRNLDRVIDGVQEIYTTKKYFDKLRDANGSQVQGAKDMPVIEKALGSTKQLGTYREKPVYSHGTPGKGEDDVYVVGQDRNGKESKGWIDG